MPYRRALLALLLGLFVGTGSAQISVPDFGTRGEVPAPLQQRFVDALRGALRAAGLEVAEGELITPGIAGSLEPEFAVLIAELDGVRYAVSGELAEVREPRGGAPYGVNLIVVDAEQGRSTDLITRPLAPSRVDSVAGELAATIASFLASSGPPPAGDAGLFVSSEPGEAQLLLDGVPVGRTSQLDVLMLRPGRYRLELRKEGYLPATRMVDVRAGDTSFLHVILTSIAGGSVQVASTPQASVYVEGELMGTTPLTLPLRPGTASLRLEREGFLPEVVTVPVRNYRVSRLDVRLRPEAEPLLYWPERREVLVFLDGRLQPGGYARGLRPGPVRVELRRGDEVRAFDLVVPPVGVYELDLETGALIPRG